jgi:hypothetical protein
MNFLDYYISCPDKIQINLLLFNKLTFFFNRGIKISPQVSLKIGLTSVLICLFTFTNSPITVSFKMY